MSNIINDNFSWKGGRRKCLTFSYDDGVTQDGRLIELMNRYGVKCTFNLNPGLFGRKGKHGTGSREVSLNRIPGDKIAEFYQGYEIAAHGWEHVHLRGLREEECISEIARSKAALEQILQRPVTGYAYAYGEDDPAIVQAVAACGLRYARTVVSTGSFEIPENFLLWHPTCRHADPRLFELAEMFLEDGPAGSSAGTGPAKLFYVWGHAYEFDEEDSWGEFERFLKMVSGRSDIWYATNGEIESFVCKGVAY